MITCRHFIINDDCKACRELQSRWYKQLDDSGFDDAEDSTLKDRPLKAWHRNILSHTTILELEITQDYYTSASALIHTYQFKNDIQRTIWELHCQGLSRLGIEKAIEGLEKSCKQSQIRNIIKDIERDLEW